MCPLADLVVITGTNAGGHYSRSMCDGHTVHLGYNVFKMQDAAWDNTTRSLRLNGTDFTCRIM
jgi:hypothetical protein